MKEKKSETPVPTDLDALSQDTLSMDKTMADFFLLAHCDMVIYTDGSSFGREAALIGRCRCLAGAPFAA